MKSSLLFCYSAACVMLDWTRLAAEQEAQSNSAVIIPKAMFTTGIFPRACRRLLRFFVDKLAPSCKCSLKKENSRAILHSVIAQPQNTDKYEFNFIQQTCLALYFLLGKRNGFGFRKSFHFLFDFVCDSCLNPFHLENVLK